jgi:hypothetical protein
MAKPYPPEIIFDYRPNLRSILLELFYAFYPGYWFYLLAFKLQDVQNFLWLPSPDMIDRDVLSAMSAVCGTALMVTGIIQLVCRVNNPQFIRLDANGIYVPGYPLFGQPVIIDYKSINSLKSIAGLFSLQIYIYHNKRVVIIRESMFADRNDFSDLLLELADRLDATTNFETQNGSIEYNTSTARVY